MTCLSPLLLITNLLVSQTLGARILLVPFSHCANSHLYNFEKLADILLQQHDVTMVTNSEYKMTRIQNIKNGSVELLQYTGLFSSNSQICGYNSLEKFLHTPIWKIVTTFYRSTYQVCHGLLSDKHFMTTLKQGRYDLAIYDAVDPCSRIIADFLDIPFVVFNTHGLENILPRHPAYMPSLLTGYSNQMTLGERVLNTLSYAVQKLITHITLKYYSQLRAHHQLNATQDLSETYNRASLRFILGDYALDYVGPTQPSHILIGGFIQTPIKTEIDVTKTLIDGQEDTIVVSMGSMIQYYGASWREIFAKALSKVPYKVIWRYRDKELPRSLGNNTQLVPWLPQEQLLKNSRTRIFITHCGLNSVYEAATYGVPIVGIPLYGDQFFQAAKVTNHVKMGISLNVNTMTPDALYDAIMTIHKDPSYRKRAKEISRVLRNRPFSQQELILNWVNHVIKLRGTSHLHSQPYYDLTWYQYFLCDVVCIMVPAFATCVCVVVYLVTRVLQYIKPNYITKRSPVARLKTIAMFRAMH